MRLLIAGGRVYDPRHAVDGAVRDIAIEDGKIVAGGRGFAAERRLDAAGCVVFPGGVDMHCHIAGPSVNRARRLVAQDGAGPGEESRLVPSAVTTGRRYAALGYTTAVEAAVAPSAARQCHLELADTPNIDRGFLLLLGNHELLLGLLARGEREAARGVAAELLRRCGAFGIKAVNAGGVALWKRSGGLIDDLDQELGSTAVTPRAILTLLAEVAEEQRLPHALHIHAHRLGAPGNIEATLSLSRALDGRRHHLTHAQFHAYGANDRGTPVSAARRLAEHLNAHPELTLDVGQVMFEEALTLSADLALEHLLWRLTGKRHAAIDLELETGCGIVPFEYSPRSRLHALQWAVGMELFLLAADPWRLALSTDHPNGGSFLSYPLIIALLMSRDRRAEAIRAASAAGLESTCLRDLDREYTLLEIATITRAAPARILGLDGKGHLGPGADADVVVYDDLADREAMFRSPRHVVKGGLVVHEKGEPRDPVDGSTFRAAVSASPDGARALRSWHERYGSFQLDQLGPEPARLAGLAAVHPPARTAP